MKITEFKTGYSVLIRYKFNIRNPKTWISPFTRFFINIWNYIKERPICRYNHSGSIIVEDNTIWLFEAIGKGYKRTLLQDKINAYGLENFVVLIPLFHYNEGVFISTAYELEGNNTKYNLAGLLLFEPIYQVSNERLWLGNKTLGRTVFCSEVDSYLNYKSTQERLFKEYYKTDPEDRFFSNLFLKIKLT